MAAHLAHGPTGPSVKCQAARLSSPPLFKCWMEIEAIVNATSVRSQYGTRWAVFPNLGLIVHGADNVVFTAAWRRSRRESLSTASPSQLPTSSVFSRAHLPRDRQRHLSEPRQHDHLARQPPSTVCCRTLIVVVVYVQRPLEFAGGGKSASVVVSVVEQERRAAYVKVQAVRPLPKQAKTK